MIEIESYCSSSLTLSFHHHPFLSPPASLIPLPPSIITAARIGPPHPPTPIIPTHSTLTTPSCFSHPLAAGARLQPCSEVLAPPALIHTSPYCLSVKIMQINLFRNMIDDFVYHPPPLLTSSLPPRGKAPPSSCSFSNSSPETLTLSFLIQGAAEDR